MRIAIIGSGISGLTVAHLLHRKHDITLFESDDRLGGHTATVDVEEDGQSLAVDTGFIVFNDWTYPNFIKLGAYGHGGCGRRWAKSCGGYGIYRIQ